MKKIALTVAIVLSAVFLCLSCANFFAFAEEVEGAVEYKYTEEEIVENVHDTRTAYLFDEEVFTSLDYGIYWYGADRSLLKATDSKNPNFDSKKPTIIFVHGWQPDQGYNSRELLYYAEACQPDDPSERFVAMKWLEKGYNVGQFFWNQLADEANTEDAMKKIYTTDYGMRYRKLDGSYTSDDDETNPTDSVIELFIDSYLKAMGSYQGTNVTFAGHSMGAHIVSAAADYLASRTANLVTKPYWYPNLVPDRVSLIDPYSCYPTENDFHIDYKNEDAEGRYYWELLTENVEDLASKGIAVDAYFGMDLAYNSCYKFGFGSKKDRVVAAYDKLFLNAVCVYLDGMKSLPMYGIGADHVGARDYYFAAFDKNIYALYNRNGEEVKTDNIGPDATAGVLYALKGKTFEQVAYGTWSLEDDYYIPVEPYTKNVVNLLNVNEGVGIISGRAFLDTNYDSYMNGATTNMVKGTEVVLLDSNGNVKAKTYTDSNGFYKFEKLKAGKYTIKFNKTGLQSYLVSELESEYSSYITKDGTVAVTLREGGMAVINAGYVLTILYVFLTLLALVIIGTVTVVVVLVVRKKKAAEKETKAEQPKEVVEEEAAKEVVDEKLSERSEEVQETVEKEELKDTEEVQPKETEEKKE